MNFRILRFICALVSVWALSSSMVATAAAVPPGESVFGKAGLHAFNGYADASNGLFSVTNSSSKATGQVIRAEVYRLTPVPWDVQLQTPPNLLPLKTGEHLLGSIHVRCVESPTGIGTFSAHVQSTVPDWQSICSTDVVVGKEWRTIYLHGKAERDAQPDGYGISIHLGLQPQTLEFSEISLLNLGTQVDETQLPVTALIYPGQEADAAWRKAAAERIETHRKADLSIRVVDRNGKPVNGAKVQVNMQRHAYGFGTFLDYRPASDKGADADQLRHWTQTLFNRCTTPIYWADWGWANPKIRAEYLETAQWAKEQHLTTRGHCILYPGWEFLPAEVRSLTNNPPALRQRLLDQVVEATEATKAFGFAEYDVCNELRHLTEIHSLLGRDAVVEWFKVAREHAPNSKMAINENTILTRSGATQAEQDHYADWIQYLIDAGQAPDVIGMQGHFDEALTNPETVLRILDRFAAFGKPIQITEFDINTRDEAGQAQYTRDFLTAVFSHPATEAYTVWGFWEKEMWQPDGALFRTDWTAKPNLKAWQDLIYNQWWTDATITTGPDGTGHIRGFLGDYCITARFEEKEQTIQTTLAKPATSVTIPLDSSAPD